MPTLSTSDYAPSYISNSASLRFDDDNDWISMHTGPYVADASFTMMAWVKRTETGKAEIFFQGEPETNKGLQLGIDDDGRHKVRVLGQ
jgi:hypothetical protein